MHEHNNCFFYVFFWQRRRPPTMSHTTHINYIKTKIQKGENTQDSEGFQNNSNELDKLIRNKKNNKRLTKTERQKETTKPSLHSS